MHAQLDLEVIHKRLQKKEIPYNFHEFGVEKCTIKKTFIKKITLMFEYYDLLDPKEQQGVIF
jgi:hypothetical protein